VADARALAKRDVHGEAEGEGEKLVRGVCVAAPHVVAPPSPEAVAPAEGDAPALAEPDAQGHALGAADADGDAPLAVGVYEAVGAPLADAAPVALPPPPLADSVALGAPLGDPAPPPEPLTLGDGLGDDTPLVEPPPLALAGGDALAHARTLGEDVCKALGVPFGEPRVTPSRRVSRCRRWPSAATSRSTWRSARARPTACPSRSRTRSPRARPRAARLR